MARTNTSGWLAGRVTLAAAALIAGGAFVASTSAFTPVVAWADEAAQAEGQAGAPVTTQISGSYYLASAQSVVDSMNAARGEAAPLESTQALEAQAQARAAQCAENAIHSAQNSQECVAFLPAANTNVADIAATVEQMTASWFNDASPFTNPENAYCGVALFQTQTGDMYLVAVFSSEAGNLSEGGAYVRATEGSGLQEDGTEAPVPATMKVTVDSSALTVAVFATQPDGTQSETGTYEPGTQLVLSYVATDNGTPVTLPGATYGSDNPEVARIEGEALTTLNEGIATVSVYADGQWLASTSLTVAGQAPAVDGDATPGDENGAGEGDAQPNGDAIEGDGAGEGEGDSEPPAVAQFTVSFDANGGAGEMDPVSVSADAEFAAPECAFTAPDGQEFDCWTNADGIETYPAGTNLGLLAGDTTLYAKWKDVEPAPVTQFTVSFDANGGEGAMDPVTVSADAEYTAPECAFTAPEGQEFDCWTNADGTETYPAGTNLGLLAGDTTLYAKWKDVEPAPVTHFTVSFDANGGTGEMAPADVDADAEYTVPASTFTAPSGKVFDSWNTAADGTGTKYMPQDAPAIHENMTLFAQWVAAPATKCTVTFDANGGAGSMDVLTADLGTTVTLPASTFTRDGYVFAGWNTAADGTGTAIVNGGQLTLGSDATLYAQWKTADTKFINGIQNNLTATTTAGTAPTLPTTASVRWSDGSTTNETVTWNTPANYADLYAKAGTFEVTGTVQGHNVKCTVTVTAAANQPQNGIAKTGDTTDNTPIYIAAGVGVVVVVLAIVLILKSRKK